MVPVSAAVFALLFAAILGISAESVGKQKTRALEKLRKFMT